MGVYILYLGQNNKLSQKQVDEMVSRHENQQDTVLVKPVDEIIENGFKIIRQDDTAANVLKRDSEAAKKSVDLRVMEKLAKEKKIIAEGGKASGDTSVTKGVKPYKPAKGNAKR